MSTEQMRAETLLAKAGVFKGHSGLRRLAESQEFWDKQPYGTRLYFEDSGDGYLQRGVLQTAVLLLDEAALHQEQITKLRAALEAMLAAHPSANDGLDGLWVLVNKAQVNACRAARAALKESDHG